MGRLRILGDWGVSACRLWLHDGERIHDRVSGKGIKLTGDPARAFADMTSRWRDLHGCLPALLCGTVGANIGWHDAGYVRAPATASDLAKCVVSVGEDTHILPGTMTNANLFGLPDVMRSEDVQALGWGRLRSRPDAWLCLPGSHTKWVELRGGAVVHFATSFVGELFEVLSKHSTLTESRSGDGSSGPGFKEGIAAGLSHPAPLSGLFHIRARTARNLDSAPVARERLSGFLVGADCAAMLQTLGRAPDAIVGEGAIAGAYASAFLQLGRDVPVHHGEACAIAGLLSVQDHM